MPLRLFLLFCFLCIAFNWHCKPKQWVAYLPDTSNNPVSVQQLHSELVQKRFPMVSAHRGGRRYTGYPENSIALFEYTLAHCPAIIECDVQMSADSVFFLLHDETLDRTTTGKGVAAQKKWAKLEKLLLVDDFGSSTAYRIPTLEKVLHWADEKGVILMLDLKGTLPLDRIVTFINKNNADDNVAVIVDNDTEAVALYTLAPQLYQSLYIANAADLNQYLEAEIPSSLIFAFVGTLPPAKAFYQQLQESGIPAILGTVGKLDSKAIALGDDTYVDYVEAGAGILATDRPIETAVALKIPNSKPLQE